MPERKIYKGREVKNASRVVRNKQALIKITFKSGPGKPGYQIHVTPEEYEANLKRTFVLGKGAKTPKSS